MLWLKILYPVQSCSYRLNITLCGGMEWGESYCGFNILLFFIVGILARLAEDDQSDMQKQGYEYIRCAVCTVSCFDVTSIIANINHLL